MTSTDERQPLEILAEEYLERIRRGEPASVEEFARRHPELAAEIRELFPTLDAMELAATSEPDRENVPLRTLGTYEVVRELGRGGQGTVYLARDKKLSRDVALKVLWSALGTASGEQLRRFQREAEATARIDDPGICTVYEAGEVDGTHFIAMRYLEGRTLAEALRRTREDPEAGALVGLPEPRASTSDTEDSEARGGSTSGSRREVWRVVAVFERVARALCVIL